MHRKFSLLLPIDIFKDLEAEALREKISISDVIRDKILRAKKSSLSASTQSEESTFEAFTKSSVEHSEKSLNSILNIDFATLETLYLFREFLFERNAQILKRVDEKMERRFGKARKRIV